MEIVERVEKTSVELIYPFLLVEILRIEVTA